MEVRGLLKEILDLPKGKEILKCIQCGTCTGSCPMAEVMDMGPRKLFAMIKGGSIEEALESNTYWICASCYYCTVRCPRGIKITDVMYAFKQYAIGKGYVSPRTKAPSFYLSFKEVVENHGRLSEAKFMQKFALKNPGIILNYMKTGLKLLSKKRVEFGVESIKGLDVLRKMIEKTERIRSEK